jgi:hypothetical protein
MEKSTCPKCGHEIELGKMIYEESLVGVPDSGVKFSSRKFQAVCPTCGPILNQKVGHHSTLAVKELKNLFPKAHLKRLRAALPKDERRLFNETLSGKRIAKDGEIERWSKILKSLLD